MRGPIGLAYQGPRQFTHFEAAERAAQLEKSIELSKNEDYMK